jgi:hypothetical protein
VKDRNASRPPASKLLPLFTGFVVTVRPMLHPHSAEGAKDGLDNR